MQAFFLVADDIMDGSTTRRGQPCWYKRDDVGMTAVNDAILLETCIYTLLHNHFHDQPNYLDTLEAFIYVSPQIFKIIAELECKINGPFLITSFLYFPSITLTKHYYYQSTSKMQSGKFF